MSSIITPTIWTQQPQYPVGIDRSNPLTNGLRRAIIANNPYDLAEHKPVTRTNLVATKYGIAAKPTGATQPLYYGSYLEGHYLRLSAGKSFTIVASIPELLLQGSNPGLWREGGSSAGTTFCIVQGAGSNRPWIRVNGTDVLKPTTGEQLTLGSSVTIAYRVTSGTEASVFWNGVKRYTATHSTATAQSDFYIFGIQSSSAEYVGSLSSVLIYDVALGDAELVSITQNPWQVFQPIQPIYLGVPAASGAYTLTADYGSFSLSGTAATLTAQRKVTADSGSFALTGTSAVLKHNHVLAANSGSIALTGTAATLTYTPVGGYTLPANGGSFSLSGTAASLLASRKVVAGSGSFTLTGTAATLSLVKLLTAGSGSFTLSGTAATFAKTNVLVAGEGAYSLVGTSATLTHGVSLTDSQKIDLILDILSNRQELDSATGTYTLYADDGVTVLYTAAAWEDAAGAIPYRGRELRRLDALV